MLFFSRACFAWVESETTQLQSNLYIYCLLYIYIFRKVALRYKYIAFLITAKKALII